MEALFKGSSQTQNTAAGFFPFLRISIRPLVPAFPRPAEPQWATPALIESTLAPLSTVSPPSSTEEMASSPWVSLKAGAPV